MPISKIKQLATDFIVEEIPDRLPEANGSFAFYRLEKSGWTTPDALDRIRREWKVDTRKMSYGGLKDRHGKTTQFFTIQGGHQRSLALPGICVDFQGFLNEPYSALHFSQNKFTITLRNIKNIDSEIVENLYTILSEAGVPNYFDDQRFGSINQLSDDFIGKQMVMGNFEQAIKIALTLPYPHDKSITRKEKKHLLTHWGNWGECKLGLGKGHARSIVDYLIHHPASFKAAAERLRTELSGLYLAAYQSHVWNLILGEWIRSNISMENSYILKLKLGKFPAPLNKFPLIADSIKIPLPSVRLKIGHDHPFYSLICEVLSKEGFTLEKMKVSGSRKLFFSRGERLAIYFPQCFHAQKMEDELNKNKFALKMKFQLPKGSYATMLIKCVQSLLESKRR